jgi:hypothetical protein
MIRSVVEGHGGAVREVGREKRGATFEMYLPIADAVEVTDATDVRDDAEVALDAAVHGDPLDLLDVDDADLGGSFDA